MPSDFSDGILFYAPEEDGITLKTGVPGKIRKSVHEIIRSKNFPVRLAFFSASGYIVNLIKE